MNNVFRDEEGNYFTTPDGDKATLNEISIYESGRKLEALKKKFEIRIHDVEESFMGRIDLFSQGRCRGLKEGIEIIDSSTKS